MHCVSKWFTSFTRKLYRAYRRCVLLRRRQTRRGEHWLHSLSSIWWNQSVTHWRITTNKTLRLNTKLAISLWTWPNQWRNILYFFVCIAAQLQHHTINNRSDHWNTCEILNARDPIDNTRLQYVNWFRKYWINVPDQNAQIPTHINYCITADTWNVRYKSSGVCFVLFCLFYLKLQDTCIFGRHRVNQ